MTGRKNAAALVPLLVFLGLTLSTCLFREPDRYYGDGYSIKFPKGWEVSEEEEGMVSAYSPLVKAGDEFSEFVNIVVEEGPCTMSLEAYMSLSLKNIQGEFGFQLIDRGKTTIGGNDTEWLTYYMKVEGMTIQGMSYLFVKGRRGYTVNCVALPGTFHELKPLFQDVTRTFKIE